MDYVSVSKANRLFWLGRYYERTSLTLQYIMQRYDDMIDSDFFDYKDYCRAVGIPDSYGDNDTFFNKYIFDINDAYSIRSAAESALSNGMVLRETIGSSTLAYLQMAVYDMDEILYKESSIGLGLQQVLDNIMAFRGCYDDFIADDNIRNTIKVGASIERLSFLLRTRYFEDKIPNELMKFLKRMPRTNLPVSALPLQSLVRQMRIFEGKNPTDVISKDDFLAAVESVYLV